MLDEAAGIAASWKADGGPLVIADYADNPGSGAYGDSTALLSSLVAAGITDACFGPMVDADVAVRLQSEDIGRLSVFALGGKTAPAFGGGPLHLTGIVRWRGDGHYVGSGPILGGQQRSFGAAAVLRVAGIDILDCQRRASATRPAPIRDFRDRSEEGTRRCAQVDAAFSGCLHPDCRTHHRVRQRRIVYCQLCKPGISQSAAPDSSARRFPDLSAVIQLHRATKSSAQRTTLRNKPLVLCVGVICI